MAVDKDGACGLKKYETRPLCEVSHTLGTVGTE